MQWRERLASASATWESLSQQSPRTWLSPAESERLGGLRTPAQRLLWLGGRWLAKQLLAELLPEGRSSLGDLHLESRDGRARAVRPRVYWRGRLQPWAVSISHDGDWLYAAACLAPTARLGVDVADPRFVDRRRLAFWFTPAERRWCDLAVNPSAAAVVWCLKEALYKAENRGEPFVPRRLDVFDRLPPEAARAEHPLGRQYGGECVLEHGPRRFLVRLGDRRLTALVIAGLPSPD